VVDGGFGGTAHLRGGGLGAFGQRRFFEIGQRTAQFLDQGGGGFGGGDVIGDAEGFGRCRWGGWLRFGLGDFV
jgi:hypothetical protein